MTAQKKFKRQVRERAAKTGESYTAALRQLRPDPPAVEAEPDREPGSGPKRVRLAVAQSIVRSDPRSRAELRASGTELRELMARAQAADARLVHFPEGATCFPHKQVAVVDGVKTVEPSDWDRADWATLHEELAAIAATARDLSLWCVLGSVHRLTPPHRPHNSLYVVSDQGTVVTRYDERFLSHTKITHMYAPGTAPVTFELDGVRFGCALGMEAHFPEVFSEYERLDVDCVLFSTTGGLPADGPMFATEAQGHAATNSYWVSFAVPAEHSRFAPSGVIAPDGGWLARGPDDGTPAVAVAVLDDTSETVEIAVSKARPWRRRARADIYDPHLVRDDPRSTDRSGF